MQSDDTAPAGLCVRMREEQHQQVMRRRQEMEREAAATFMSKKAGDAGSMQKLDEPTPAVRTTRQNTVEDRTAVKTEVVEKQKLRFVLVSPQALYKYKCKKLKQFKTRCKDDMVNSDN